MGCVHTRQKLPTIEGWGNPNHIRSIKKTREDNQKVGKINRYVNQAPHFGPEHNKILSMMGFRYPTEEHAKKGMMVQMIRNEILKLNHLLPNELFKQKKTCVN
jgi:hypothetical protein